MMTVIDAVILRDLIELTAFLMRKAVFIFGWDRIFKL